VIPWSPLARGFLTGSRTRETPRTTVRANSDEFADQMYFTEDDFRVLDALTQVSRDRGAKPAQVALSWMLSVPGITAPIVGVTKLEHLEDAAAAVEIRLEPEEIKKLEQPYVPHGILGHRQPGPRD
jgi:1-deoxyxylulose-5-phosphate synthase